MYEQSLYREGMLPTQIHRQWCCYAREKEKRWDWHDFGVGYSTKFRLQVVWFRCPVSKTREIDAFVVAYSSKVVGGRMNECINLMVCWLWENQFSVSIRLRRGFWSTVSWFLHVCNLFVIYRVAWPTAHILVSAPIVCIRVYRISWHLSKLAFILA